MENTTKSCPHHKDYDPGTGEPEDHLGTDGVLRNTCVGCWKAYAAWIEHEAHRRLTNLYERYKEAYADQRRMSAIAGELLVCFPPTPQEDKFDGLWVICDYCLPDQADCLSSDRNLRKAIDLAMGLHPKVN